MAKARATQATRQREYDDASQARHEGVLRLVWSHANKTRDQMGRLDAKLKKGVSQYVTDGEDVMWPVVRPIAKPEHELPPVLTPEE